VPLGTNLPPLQDGLTEACEVAFAEAGAVVSAVIRHCWFTGGHCRGSRLRCGGSVISACSSTKGGVCTARWAAHGSRDPGAQCVSVRRIGHYGRRGNARHLDERRTGERSLHSIHRLKRSGPWKWGSLGSHPFGNTESAQNSASPPPPPSPSGPHK